MGGHSQNGQDGSAALGAPGWRTPSALRARRNCRDGFVAVRAADVAAGQALSSIAAISAHNHAPAACAVGRQRGAGVIALFQASGDDADSAGSQRPPRLRQAGKPFSVPGEPTAVSWCDETLACGTREGSVELFRLDPTRDSQARGCKVAASLQPQWGTRASSQQAAAAGTGGVAVGARDGRNAGRIGAVVGASSCLWDAQHKEIVLDRGPDAGAASCIDLDWDKGVIVLGDCTGVDHNLTVYDPRQANAAARAKAAHFATLSSVRCSPLHPHRLASGSVDGLVKVWDFRRLDTSLFRLGWHVSAVSDLGWSWAHSDMLVSSALDGTLRFWNLSLPPHYQLTNADASWEQREIVGCCMLPWPHHPLDSLAASSDGLLQLVRVSHSRVMQPLARLESQHLVSGVRGVECPAAGVDADTLASRALDVTAAVSKRDMAGGGKALLSLLPMLCKEADWHALGAAERLLLMLVSGRDMSKFAQHASSCCESLFANAHRAQPGWEQLLAMPGGDALLDPASGDAEEDAVEEVKAQVSGEQGERFSGQHPSADVAASLGVQGIPALGEIAVAEAVAAGEALFEQDVHGRGHVRRHVVALDMGLPARLGPARGVGRAMEQDQVLQLSKALHMVRALREAHAQPDARSSREDEFMGAVTPQAGGRSLLKPSSCRYMHCAWCQCYPGVRQACVGETAE